MIAAETRKIRTIAQRSEAMIESMSPPSVDSSRAPLIVFSRRIGTATEMIVSPLALTRTTFCTSPVRAAATSGKFLLLRPLNSSVAGGGERPNRPFTAFHVRSMSVMESSGCVVVGVRSER